MYGISRYGEMCLTGAPPGEPVASPLTQEDLFDLHPKRGPNYFDPPPSKTRHPIPFMK